MLHAYVLKHPLRSFYVGRATLFQPETNGLTATWRNSLHPDMAAIVRRLLDL